EPAAPETIEPLQPQLPDEPANESEPSADASQDRTEQRLQDQFFAPDPSAPSIPSERVDAQPAEPAPAFEAMSADDQPAAFEEPTGDQPQPESSVEAPPSGAEAEPRPATSNGDEEPGNEEPGDENPAHARVDSVAETSPPSQPETVNTLGSDEAEEEAEARRPSRNFYRRYRIQEVVARRQIMLVQVQKEERGNKGAALTTYISLAGRYCVLMPNTPRGGGVSRKITSQQDRKRLKSLIEDLEIPDGMAVIVRTAGMERTKAEIKRDYEYLVKLWDDIRERTMSSTAPALIYEEASLIKRAIRDVYSKEIDEILVEGEEGYKAAKGFMKLLMPSHAKRVQVYNGEGIPLFHRYQIESQLDSIHSPSVQLRSGGYIVMNSTEALVAVDVNSGRATRERNIEETAYRTNLEAADEIARQLRLRDLAGLIVIDFIDMEEHRNKANVERRLKDALRQDRARIQVGRISAFGLLEMSRQRLRPSLFESSTQVCQACGGTGFVRSTESTALHVMRAIEEEGMRRRSAELTVYVPSSVALYMLNQKRQSLAEIERRYDFHVIVATDDKLIPPAHRIERAALRGEPGQPVHAVAHADAPPRADDGARVEPARQEQPRPDQPRHDHGRREQPRHERVRHEDARPDSVRRDQPRDDDAAQPGQPPGEFREGRRRRRRRRRGRGGDFDGTQPRAPLAQAQPGVQADNRLPAQNAPALDDVSDVRPAAAQAAISESTPAASVYDPMVDTTPAGDVTEQASVLSESQDEHTRLDAEQRDGRRRRRGRRGGRRRRRGRIEDDAVETAGAESSLGDAETQPSEPHATGDRPIAEAHAESRLEAQPVDRPDTKPAERGDVAASVIRRGDDAASPEHEPRREWQPAPQREPQSAMNFEAEPTKPRRDSETARPVEPPKAVLTPTPIGDATPPAAADETSRPKRSGWWQRLIE
ncbi:MAG: Rne/Rng family ribonuclease, partial [Alphaproteobacteria bacterium]